MRSGAGEENRTSSYGYAQFAEFIIRQADSLERFRRAGIRISLKSSLANLLWLREQNDGLPADTIWLSAADFILRRLAGEWGIMLREELSWHA